MQPYAQWAYYYQPIVDSSHIGNVIKRIRNDAKSQIKSYQNMCYHTKSKSKKRKLSKGIAMDTVCVDCGKRLERKLYPKDWI